MALRSVESWSLTGLTNLARQAPDVRRNSPELLAFLNSDAGDRLVRAIRNYVAQHPYATTAQVTAALAFIAPGFIVAPVLSMIGFSALGPTAGSAAAAYQSAHGATWLFSTLQSAAMGGYGTAAVHGAAQGASVVTASIAQWWKCPRPAPTG